MFGFAIIKAHMIIISAFNSLIKENHNYESGFISNLLVVSPPSPTVRERGTGQGPVQLDKVLEAVRHEEGVPKRLIPKVHWNCHWYNYCQRDIKVDEVPGISLVLIFDINYRFSVEMLDRGNVEKQ